MVLGSAIWAQGASELLVPFFFCGDRLARGSVCVPNAGNGDPCSGFVGRCNFSKFIGCGLGALGLGKINALRIGVGMIPLNSRRTSPRRVRPPRHSADKLSLTLRRRPARPFLTAPAQVLRLRSLDFFRLSAVQPLFKSGRIASLITGQLTR